MLARSLTAQAPIRGGVSISAAALANANARLASMNAESSSAPSSANAPSGVSVPAKGSSSAKADRIASATATVDRLMAKASRGGGLDLGLDFNKMDFKKIVNNTQQAINRERMGGPAPIGGPRIPLPQQTDDAARDSNGASGDELAAARFSVYAGKYSKSGGGSEASAAARRGGDPSTSSTYYSSEGVLPPNPNRTSSVMAKMRDFQIGNDWEGALGYFTSAVGNPIEYRRWHIQHISILIDLLGINGKMTELWKVWRLARATNKFEDVNEGWGNKFMHRIGRLSVLEVVVNDPQLAQWWVDMARDILKLMETKNLTLDTRNEKTVTVALSADDPQTAIRKYIEEIAATRAAEGKGVVARGESGGSSARGGSNVRSAARNAYQRSVTGSNVATSTTQKRAAVDVDDGSAEQQQQQQRGPREILTTLDLNQALTYAKTTTEVEQCLALALERNIEFNDDTFAKRIQRLGLRRKEAFRQQKSTWTRPDGSLVFGSESESVPAAHSSLSDEEVLAQRKQKAAEEAAAAAQEENSSHNNAATTATEEVEATTSSGDLDSPSVGSQVLDTLFSDPTEASRASVVSSSSSSSTQEAADEQATAGRNTRGSAEKTYPRTKQPDRTEEHAALDAEILAETKRLFHEANVYSNRAASIRLFDPSLSPEEAAAMTPEELLGMHIVSETSASARASNGETAEPTLGHHDEATIAATSLSSLPSTSLCNAVMYELRRNNSFEDLRLMEAMMRGPEALTPRAGAFWRVSPSSKTVDHLISAYYRAGHTERCKELFDEMKVNYAARLSPLVYTTMIKIQSEDTMPKRDAESGRLTFPKPAVPKGMTPRMAAIAAHQELNQLIHQLAADGADRKLNDNANIALINKWAQSRRRK